MTPVRRIGAAVLLALVAAGCAKVPYSGRSQLMTISEAEEVRLGEEAFREATDKASLIEDARTELLRTVGMRIAAAAGRSDFRWEFVLIEGAEANAFALPGGKVAFYSGIIPYCEDEDGVAAVMAHEVAHVLARHGAERLSQARLLDVGGAAVSAVLSGGSPALRQGVLGAYGMGGKVGVLLPFSRRHEAEADEIGLVLMAKAGFDPRAALDVWRRLLASGRAGEAPNILSSHPSGEDRLRDLQALMPIALEYYQKSERPAPAKRRDEGRKDEISPEEVLRRLEEPDPAR